MPAPLSIIIPAFNAEAVLPLCLSSLMVGLEAGLIREVIVVDGGSEDQTRRLAEGSGASVVSAPDRGRAQYACGAGTRGARSAGVRQGRQK